MTKVTREQVCGTLQAGDAITVHDIRAGFASKAIQRFSRGTASHVLCCIGGLDIIEATVGGVSYTNMHTYLCGRYRLTVKRVPRALTHAEQVQVREYWLRRVGTDYGWGSVVLAGIRLGLKRFLAPWAPKAAKWTLTAIHTVLGHPRPDCSALWVYGIRVVNPRIMGAYEADEVDPEMILRDSHLKEIAQWEAPILED